MAVNSLTTTKRGKGKFDKTLMGTIDLEKLKQVGNALMENWKWAWTTDIDDDLAKAVKMLEEQIA